MKDETAFAITKFLNGYIFLMEVGGYREGYSDNTLKELVLKAKFWKCNIVKIEPNFGDGMFTKLITPIFLQYYPCAVEEGDRAVGQKEKRIIDILEPVFARHRLIVNESVLQQDYKVYEKESNYSLVYQITRLCGERGALGHDDRVEVVAEAVRHWSDTLSVDQNAVDNERLEEDLEKWLDPDRGVLYIEEVEKPLKKEKRYGILGNILEGIGRHNYW